MEIVNLFRNLTPNRLNCIILTCIFLSIRHSDAQINNSTNSSILVQALKGLEGRIVNGSPAQPGQFPYQVAVYADMYLCGGSILNNNTVLTAAHCVYYNDKKHKIKPIPAKKIQILAGDVNLKSSKIKKFKVQSVYPHEQYDPIAIKNDLAIIKIRKHFWTKTPSVNIQPIAVTSIEYPKNTKCVAAGWGRTNSANPSTPNKLLHTNLAIYNHDWCTDLYKYSKADITDSMICASSNQSNVCLGDSGGALVTNNNGTPQVIGIVSFGVEGCIEDLPSVYTSVVKYQVWINKTAERNGANHILHSSNRQLIYSILIFSLIVYFK